MLQIIQNAAKSMNSYLEYGVPETILETIEKAGMLPPAWEKEWGNYYLKNVNEWEPENEKK